MLFLKIVYGKRPFGELPWQSRAAPARIALQPFADGKKPMPIYKLLLIKHTPLATNPAVYQIQDGSGTAPQ